MTPLATLAAGLDYLPDYLDRETHDRLLSGVDENRWLTSAEHRVQIYGYHYNRQADAAYRIGDIPEWSKALALRLHQDGFMPRVPNQLVANEYQPGVGIFDHMDQAVFGDVVVSVSLGSTCVMRFTHAESARVDELLLEPRSVLVLSGDVRWRWKHGIPGRLSDVWNGRELVRTRRVSLTFRTIPDEIGNP
jgi:alkylated DNA repair dioxygenase AlkB